MSARNLTSNGASMSYSFPGGQQMKLEVFARLEMSPGAFDDGEGIIIAQRLSDGAYVVFVVGGVLRSGEHWAEFGDLADAYTCALENAREHANAFLVAVSDCDAVQS